MNIWIPSHGTVLVVRLYLANQVVMMPWSISLQLYIVLLKHSGTQYLTEELLIAAAEEQVRFYCNLSLHYKHTCRTSSFTQSLLSLSVPWIYKYFKTLHFLFSIFFLTLFIFLSCLPLKPSVFLSSATQEPWRNLIPLTPYKRKKPLFRTCSASVRVILGVCKAPSKATITTYSVGV